MSKKTLNETEIAVLFEIINQTSLVSPYDLQEKIGKSYNIIHGAFKKLFIEDLISRTECPSEKGGIKTLYQVNLHGFCTYIFLKYRLCIEARKDMEYVECIFNQYEFLDPVFQKSLYLCKELKKENQIIPDRFGNSVPYFHQILEWLVFPCIRTGGAEFDSMYYAYDTSNTQILLYENIIEGIFEEYGSVDPSEPIHFLSKKFLNTLSEIEDFNIILKYMANDQILFFIRGVNLYTDFIDKSLKDKINIADWDYIKTQILQIKDELSQKYP